MARERVVPLPVRAYHDSVRQALQDVPASASHQDGRHYQLSARPSVAQPRIVLDASPTCVITAAGAASLAAYSHWLRSELGAAVSGAGAWGGGLGTPGGWGGGLQRA